MSLSIVNSTNVPLLEDEVFTGSNYDNILDFAQITISIKCDTGYILTYIYSQNKVDIDYQTSQTITVQADTQFYNVTVKDRYFKLQITANDGDMTVLNVQTIYKTSTTYAVSSGPGSNVTIIDPVDVNGYVQVTVPDGVVVSGSVTTDISGQTVDISGQTVVVDISGQTVDISGQTVVVDISGQTVDISGQTVVVDISGQKVDISGQTVDISGQTVVVDISGQTVVVDISGQKVDVGNFPSTYQIVDVNTNSVKVVPVGTTTGYTNNSLQIIDTNSKYDGSGNLYVNVNNTPNVEILSNNYASGALLVCSDIVQTVGGKLWNNVLVNQNETSNINNATFQSSSNLTIFGKADGSCTIGVQFSDSPVNEFFTSQYQITVIGAGSFGACIAGFCAPTVRLILLSADSRTITAFAYFS